LAAARRRIGACLRVGVIATLLFALAASAQDETNSETTPPDEAIESPTDETGTPPGSDTETDEPLNPEPDELAPELDDEFGIQDFRGADIEEIMIQGEAGSGTPKASPISVIGFDMNTLSKEGIKDIRNLSNFTPGLEIKSAFAASNPAIFIRGVGLDDFNANAASAVAIYQDGVYLQSAAIQLFGFFDQEGVEVLRGPQGTFYRNASAGAILVKSRPPTEEFETYIESTYGRFNQLDVNGAISGPIVPDWLSGRISGYYNSRDGTTKNRCGIWQLKKPPCRKSKYLRDGTRVEERVNDIENYGLRAQLLLAPPTLDMEWLVNVHGGQNLGHAFQYQHHAIHLLEENVNINDPEPAEVQLPIYPPYRPGDGVNYSDLDGDPFAGEYDVNGPEDLDIFGTNLHYTWNFGDAYKFESITAYEWHDRFTWENTDAGPENALNSSYADDAWQLSEELNLYGEWIGSDVGDGGWRLGAFYLQEDLHVSNFYEIFNGKDLIQDYDQKLRNFGSYIQGDYTVRPGCAPIGCDIKLDVGLRYNIEYKKFDITACPVVTVGCNPEDITLTGTEAEMWDGWSGDFTLAWYYDDQENNVYLAYHRGWKGGHFNGGATTRFDIITAVEPEKVDSYELGLRAHWFDGRLMTNITGFYYDYTDLQVFKVEQTAQQGFPIAKLINAQSATIYGIELDLGASPIEGMEITFNFAWVESVYDEFLTTLPFKFAQERPNGQGNFPPKTIFKTFDYSGNTLIASPRFSFTGSIDYEIPLPGEISGHGLGFIIPRYSFSWKDDVYFDAGKGQGAYLNFPVATFGQEAFWIHNAALSWRSESEMIEITGWVHNIFDEYYKTNSEDYSVGVNFLLHSWADPRTYGVTATISF
jgi:iron complex outermembrane receptor protein